MLVTEVDTFRVLYTESRNMILDAQVAGLPVEEDLRVAELDAIQHLGWLDGEIQKRTGAVPDLKYSAYVGYDA